MIVIIIIIALTLLGLPCRGWGGCFGVAAVQVRCRRVMDFTVELWSAGALVQQPHHCTYKSGVVRDRPTRSGFSHARKLPVSNSSPNAL